MPITVSIDFTTNPPTATFNPTTLDVTDKNCSIFRWIRADGQTFTFVSVQGITNGTAGSLPNPPFSKVFVSADGSTMLIADFNNPEAANAVFPYQITVAYQGTNYSFPPSSSLHGNPGGPAIRNR